MGSIAHRLYESHHASIGTDLSSLLAGEAHGSADRCDSSAAAIWWWRRSVLGYGRGLGHWSDRIDPRRPCGWLSLVRISRQKRRRTLGTRCLGKRAKNPI